MSALSPQKTILVIEDEFLVAIDIAEALGELGYAVTQFRTASDVDDPRAYDAVLLDHGLDGAASEKLADQLLAERIPFAFCTGLASEELRQKYPAVPTIEKPFKPGELAAVTRALFAAPLRSAGARNVRLP